MARQISQNDFHDREDNRSWEKLIEDAPVTVRDLLLGIYELISAPETDEDRTAEVFSLNQKFFFNVFDYADIRKFFGRAKLDLVVDRDPLRRGHQADVHEFGVEIWVSKHVPKGHVCVRYEPVKYPHGPELFKNLKKLPDRQGWGPATIAIKHILNFFP